MRVTYRMKFNKYVGLRPEFLFNIGGTKALKDNGFFWEIKAGFGQKWFEKPLVNPIQIVVPASL